MKLTDVADAALLRYYAEESREEAFAELVRRHFNLVWSAAWRVTHDAELARDVAQTVFVDLARKAGWLPESVILAGWLYRAASLAAHKIVRTRVRRAERERKAMEFAPRPSSDAQSGSETERLLPLLDEALGKLGAADRNALVLRFFAQKNLIEVGKALGVSDDAAQKRLSRALEKLRVYFRRRGLTVSAGAIAASLGAAGAQAAPAGLSLAIASSSLALASSGAVPGLLAFVPKLQTQLTLMKTKLAILALASVGVGAPLVIQQKTIHTLQQENRAWEDQTQLLADLRSENQQLRNRQTQIEELQKLRRDHDELIALQTEVDRARASGAEGLNEELASATEKLRLAQERTTYVEKDIKAKKESKDAILALKNIGLAARIFSTEHQDRFPTSFEEMKELIASQFKDLPFDQFEFVNHVRPVSESEPQLLLFQEKAPRQLPDGTWAKAFCFCDGSVQERISKDGNFDQWEKQFMADDTKASAAK